MCGIAGVIGGDVRQSMAIVEQMNVLQLHRGPDHAVATVAGRAVFGNTRLAIQDPTPEGNQPFSTPDGRVVAVFNGEIYNWRELVERFDLDVRSGCDGEVIPLLWERIGPRCLGLLRGMWALAVADTRSGDVTLARDPFGIKPLHWRDCGDGVIGFASEPRSLRVLGSLTPSRRAVSSFLRFGAVPATSSAFDEVSAVAPNSFVSWSADGARRDGVVDPAHLEPTGHVSERALADALMESVDLHLRADVPTALLLSSGVDSTALALAARRLGHTLRCLTVSSPGGDDETPAARAIAERFGHVHTAVPATLDDPAVRSFFRHMQSPTIDGLNTFLVCAAVRSAGFKVALSGLGGDEALGGYRHMAWLPRVRLLGAVDRIPGRWWRAFAASVVNRRTGRSLDKTERLLSAGGPRDAYSLSMLQRELFAEGDVAALVGEAQRPAMRSSRSPRALALAEIELYMQPMLLTDADAFSMASSVELRVPYVDSKFFVAAVEFTSREGSNAKRSFARSLGDPVLSAAAARPKRGFGLPMGDLLARPPLRDLLTAVADPGAPVWQVVDRAAARPLLSEGVGSRWAEGWAFASLNAWLETL